MLKLSKVMPTPVIFSICLLLIASFFPFDSESGFYTFLRLSIFITCLYLSIHFFTVEKLISAWGMIFICLLYNPIIVVELRQDVWPLYDVICAVILGLVILPGGQKVKVLSFLRRYWLRLIAIIALFVGVIFLTVFLKIKKDAADWNRYLAEEKVAQKAARKKQRVVNAQKGIITAAQLFCGGLPSVNALNGEPVDLNDADDEDIVKVGATCIVFPSDMKYEERKEILSKEYPGMEISWF